MKSTLCRQAMACGLVMALGGVAGAQTLVDLGATPPVPGTSDISQLSTAGNQTAPDGLNYYTDNQADHGAGEPGQTFTTSNNAGGCLLTSVSIMTAGLNSDNGIGSAKSYVLHIYTLAGGNITLLTNFTSAPFGFSDGDWLQWNGFSVALAAGANYAYSFGKASSGGGWEAMGVASGNPYAGGEIGLFPPSGGAVTFGSSHAFDAVFDLGITLVSVPVTTIPAIAPTNNPLYAGTPVTLTENAMGKTPLAYQWRTDGGAGGTRTNIIGASAPSLNLNTTGMAAGVYHYDVVVTNSSGSSTSAVAVLNFSAASAPILVSDVSPATATEYAGGAVTFAASFSGTLPISYQWKANTGSGATNVSGATNATLTLTNLQAANSGAYYVVATNAVGGPVSSSQAQLTVLAQPAADSYYNTVMAGNPIGYWQLNETGSTTSGTLVAADVTGNFNGIYGSVSSDGIPAPSPSLGFAGFPNNNTGVQFANSVADSYVTLPPLNLNTNTVTMTAWIYPIVTPASYAGIVFSRGGGDASGFCFTSSGQIGYTWNQNNEDTWGWMSGLVPPVGQWSFIALVVSPTNAIAYLCNTNGQSSATNAVAHTAEAFNASTLIGGDNSDGGNGARTFDGVMNQVSIFASSLSPNQVLNLYYNGVSGGFPTAPQPSISPSNTVFVGSTVVLSEPTLGVPPLYYQWQTNSTRLPGATNSALTLASVTQAAALDYSVVVSNVFGSVTSPPVALTVIRDTTPPTVVRVFNLGLTNVEVDYSKLVEAASGTNPANYVFTGGTAVTAAALAANGETVLLSTAPLTYGSNYTLVINNVRDQAVPPNTIATNSTVSFAAFAYAPQDIGNPPAPSSFLVLSNGLSVTAIGGQFAGASDQGNLSYQIISGNFDVSVRVGNLSLSDVFAEAGLMAREDLTDGGRFAASMATPAMNGCFFEWRDPSGGLAATEGGFPANYPNTWLRLQRVGNVFNGYAGYDGQSWALLASDTIAMSNQVYLGYWVGSHNTNQAATAQFANIASVTNAILGAQVNPHEAIGPSSRTTPIAFSEILWKPAPRTDGKNLEFLELYNSNPWFQDISGYQITCADMTYKFPAGVQIPGGGYLVVASAPADITSVYGITNVMGPYTGSLKKSETLELLDEQTNLLLTVPYTGVYPWPVATGGTGHSMVLACPSYGEGDPRAWDISDVVGGSPGQMDGFTPSSLRNVVINEILPHSENPAVPQFIELYNHATNSVDVSGCILTDDPATNKFIIPANTTIGPAGFISFTQSQFGFTLNGAGETLYFIKPDGSRVLDAVQFGAQASGVSYGRWPDGANDFYAFTTNTPGTNNSSIVIGDIVINELMYDPISENDDDQYIELYNKGTNTINLAGWQFTSGVTFTFPSVAMAPNSYLVVARNMTNLMAIHANLNSGNTVGNYSGKLSHNGEQVTLSMPQTLYTNTPILVEEDQVTYGTGGRWGEWSSGGGSSLELIDPRSNHRLAANWADSDETQKSSWVDIENTGVLDNGANYDPSIDYAQIGLLDSGECLVDNLEVDYNGSNYVSNGAFENGLGLTNWSLQGSMVRSSLESTGYQSSYSLHIRSSDRIWTGDNSCQVALITNSLASGQTVTLRYKARWLHGWPEPLMRLNGNWLEASAAMPVPRNLGSPGLPNSQYTTNAGPAVYDVTHNPAVPAAAQPVVVTANIHDPDGVQSLTLYYRLDPATNYTAVPMLDNGTGGDAIAGDGIFSATIPGQAANQVVAFYLSARDGLGAATRFPALRPGDNEPVRECVVMFGDGNPGGSFGVYHLWLTQTNATRWANLSDLSNEGNDCTFATGNRVIYNMQGRFAGSPYHQGFDTPAGNLCHYKWEFNDDDKFLGATDFNKIHQPGNGPGDDSSLQREQLANTFLRTLGVPWLNRRYVVVYVNGNRRGSLMEDTQTPSTDDVKEHWPNDDGGFLYKMQPWFEMAPFPSGATMAFDNQSWCNVMPYTTTGGVKKPARYRYNFEIRRTPDSCNDFTNVFSLIDAANSSGTPNYVQNMEGIANMENWMRVFAANHAAGNWDSFGAQNAQNLYGYIGALGTKYSLMMWDFNIVIGNSGSWGPGQNLFTINSEDPNMSAIYANPTFLRMYWRALQDLVNGPLNVANSGPLVMAKYNAFTANGLGVENPAANIEPWLSQAQSSIASQLAAVNATNFSVNSGVTISNNVAYLTGTAPVNVSAIWLNGASYPLTWTSLTNWMVTAPLVNGANQLNLTGVDQNGQPIAGDTNSVSVVYNGANGSPVGHVVINEIMYAPLVNNAQFVELYNNSTNTAYDLSGWQLQGAGYTFPNGSSIGPANYLVLAANNAAFDAAYGSTNPVFDLFSGDLQPGQILELVQPEAGGASNVTVAGVYYDSVAPWPANADGAGASLQLMDPRQDNWRVGNWSGGNPAGTATPGAPNSALTHLPPFAPLWINELQANNLTGITNRAGQRTAWLELYNPSSNAVVMTNLYLAINYTNLTQWAFPSNAVINPGQFEVVFADGLTNLSTTNELHASFILPSVTGGVALSRLYNGQTQALDYVNYSELASNYSYGSFPDGQSFIRQAFFHATPGASNDGATAPPPSFIPYASAGSVYTQNFDSLPDPGATSVNTANPVTINGITYSLANPFDFAAAPIASGSVGGLDDAAMSGWFGLADPTASVGTRFGATDGDQTTGGDISFGSPNASNRALGLLATSTTGYTAFGAKFINDTTNLLKYVNAQFVGEIWRQSSVPKTLQCYYFIDPTATAPFSTAATGFLPALNVNFPTVATDTGGVAVNGTSSLNQTNLSVTNQIIQWPSGSALWLVWEMADSTGKAQGLGIDDFSFSASVLPSGFAAPPLAVQRPAGTNLVFSFATTAGPTYQLQYNNTLNPANWAPMGSPVSGTGNPATLNIGITNAQRFFRLVITP